MVVTHLARGLGNQLFQYAAARRIAFRNNLELVVDAEEYGPPPPGDLPVSYRRLAVSILVLSRVRAHPRK